MKRSAFYIVVLGLSSAVFLAGESFAQEAYDYFRNVQYPGPNLRPDVELYQVKQAGKDDPLAYQRREVDWWPRKGVDIIEVREGMPLRTWTLRPGPFDSVDAPAIGKPVEEVLETLEAPQNVGVRYFRRISGYLYPPATGDYTFVFAADDKGALYLSLDDQPENRKRIAGNETWVGHRQWDKFPSQTSASIPLEQGKRYYIEVLHEELLGNDHVSVGWKGPGIDQIEIIDGAYLSGLDGKRGRILAQRTDVPNDFPLRAVQAPRQFEAHLIGFRGIGNTMTSKWGGRDGGPREPAVVLRLADGRKRCFVSGSFSEADKQFIMDLYVKEMDRIKAGLDQTPRVKPPSMDIKYPNNAKPGEPGTMQVESKHFIWLSGSQAGSDGDPWVNEKDPAKAQWYRDGSVKCAEYWWALNEYAGRLMPHWDRRGRQYKYWIEVPGTKRDGFQVIPGFAGGGYGGCGIRGAGGGPWASALFHEWGHGGRANGLRMGGGEAQADTHQTLADPGEMKGNHHVRRPWRNVFNGESGYGFTVFYNMVGEDPNWGYGFFMVLPYGAEEWSVLQAMARVGEQRGMFKNGIRGLGDTVGEYGARLATFDTEIEDVYRRHYFAPARNWMETVDAERRIYRIPLEEAPEPFGVNIVRLVTDPGADELVVDFRGLHDPERYSDWRACVIAVAADGTRRYSPMWNKGEMTFKLQPGDLSHWLTVAATPTALYVGDSNVRTRLYSGRHAFRYPWSVQLKGARPGTPRESRADYDDVSFVYKATHPVPAAHDTPAGRRLSAKLEALRQELDAAEGEPANSEWHAFYQQNLRHQVQAELDRMQQGARHPNGGGWVQATATVAPMAYVGPNAMVLDRARVLDSAIVEDFAIVSGDAVVSGHARVSGQGVVTDKAKAGGYARVWQMLTGEEEAPVVPRRPGEDTLHEFGLWANYAMIREDNAILEDGYRYPLSASRGYAADLTPVLNGYLYGRPAFVTDGEHMGFRFDGANQSAELCPRAADLGQITVDIALKPEKRGAQTIFDFGGSPDDRLVLKTARDGSPELIATVGGKTVVEIAGKNTLPVGQWANVRVEIDGKKAVLWVNGNKAAEQATPFRPCEVFPGGGVKRNRLAAGRDGKNGFHGVIGHVVIYRTVHADYAALPEPTLDSPVRPTESYVARLTEIYGDLKALSDRANALSRELMAPYLEMEKRSKARQQEIMERCPEYVKATADLAAAEEVLKTRQSELEAAFVEIPENAALEAEVTATEQQRNALRNQVRTVEREAFEADPELTALTERRNEAEQRRQTAEQAFRKVFDERPANAAKRAEIEALRKDVNEQRAEVQRLEQEAFQADAELQELYTQRNEHESDRREREQALRAEFDARADIAELIAQADAARKRRHDDNLSREQRDKAAEEEGQLRRQWGDQWNGFRSGDGPHTRSERARNELNRPINEREAALRADLREESETARAYDELNHKLNELAQELRRNFDAERNADPEHAEANRLRGDLDADIRARQETVRGELGASNPLHRELRNAEREHSEIARTLRDKRQIYVSRGAADLSRKVAEAKGAVKEAEEIAWKPYAPERWLYSFNQQGFRGYYNTAYNHHFSTYARDVVGGGEMREDTQFLEALVKAVYGDKEGWHTRVDWDWRMREEIDGSIADMPLMLKWLARVRGPVMKENPAGAK